MLTESEARQLAQNTRQALLALEDTLTTPAQKAAGKALHIRLSEVAGAVRDRWPDLYPDGDADQFAAFSIGGDKPEGP